MVVPSLLAIAFSAPFVVASPVPGNKDVGPSVSNKYIVTLKDDANATNVSSHVAWVKRVHARSVAKRDEDGVDKVWDDNESFQGYSGTFDVETVKKIMKNDDVIAVEPVQVVDISEPIDVRSNIKQTDAPWGLGSISHRNPGWNEYSYDSSAGEGTWAYLIDSGVYTANVDFEGRAHLGYNAYPGTAFTDTQGHGTHCAGTIAGKVHGVAKKANIMAVKVFGDAGSSTDIVIDGYLWAVTNITNTPGRVAKSVISMSLGGSYSRAMNLALKNAYERYGIITVVAAGNDNRDARNYSPASEPSAITVGAIDIKNERARFSNYGLGVDIFAPGVDILSTWNKNPRATARLSGTSMATPHVAGLTLYLKGKEGVGSPAELTKRILSLATKGVVKNPGSESPNLLAYNGIE